MTEPSRASKIANTCKRWRLDIVATVAQMQLAQEILKVLRPVWIQTRKNPFFWILVHLAVAKIVRSTAALWTCVLVWWFARLEPWWLFFPTMWAAIACSNKRKAGFYL